MSLSQASLPCPRCDMRIEKVLRVAGAMRVPENEAVDLEVPVVLMDLRAGHPEFTNICEGAI